MKTETHNLNPIQVAAVIARASEELASWARDEMMKTGALKNIVVYTPVEVAAMLKITPSHAARLMAKFGCCDLGARTLRITPEQMEHMMRERSIRRDNRVTKIELADAPIEEELE